ncbi:hypothetical protein M569_01864 [Genlisea aurea]|uniref:Plant bHLH transcription factor ACT-like domain-containing protein n=1 Tax=Genlisea aurea TaxID=192259 RepID=S8EAL4_9LAMI|nr:hypothetical protein M569_01864 [Genlisea aurea]
MDKASIIKDAINYIESLQKEESRIVSEIEELEEETGRHDSNSEIDSAGVKAQSPPVSPLQVVELRGASVGEKTIIVSLTSCSKRREDALIQICHVFELLNLKIITANLTALRDNLLTTTIFIQGEEEEKDVLLRKIEAAISEYRKS